MKLPTHIIPTSADITDLLNTHKVSQALAAQLIGADSISFRHFRRCISGEYVLTPAQWFYLQHNIKDY